MLRARVRAFVPFALVVLALAAAPQPRADAGAYAPMEAADRFVPRAAGTERDLRLLFGPYPVGPGQDMNRITLDLPLRDGFVTRLAARAIDAETSAMPSNQILHIHHFVWLKPTLDAAEDQDLYPTQAYVFATGEERTHVDFDVRSSAAPGGPRHGVFVGTRPHVIDAMLHNKVQRPMVAYVAVDVTFIDGTRDEIRAASSCGNLLRVEGERCAAGQDLHPVASRLWGHIYDVPRDATGNGTHWHFQRLPVRHDATLVSLTGHLHPEGKEVVFANLGPAGSACERDLDSDGFPGVTIFRSRKVDRVPGSSPHSEEFQMETTQADWRAPVRKGDRLLSIGVYHNRDAAAYAAMSFAGLHEDRLAPPAPREGGACTHANTRAALLRAPGADATSGTLSRPWTDAPLPTCGGERAACEGDPGVRPGGLDAAVVQIAGFAYVPGDRALSGAPGAPPKVKAGTSLRFVNADASALVRHSVTSCPWPCNGPYLADYPVPDGAFDSGKLGNWDFFDGGLQGPDTVPAWATPSDLPVGVYAYFCRLHPTMRGAFEVVA